MFVARCVLVVDCCELCVRCRLSFAVVCLLFVVVLFVVVCAALFVV